MKKAQTLRGEYLRLKPIDLENFEILAYHDAAWANTRPCQDQDAGFALYDDDELDGLIEDNPFRSKDRTAKRAASKVARQFGVLIALADRRCTQVLEHIVEPLINRQDGA